MVGGERSHLDRELGTAEGGQFVGVEVNPPAVVSRAIKQTVRLLERDRQYTGRLLNLGQRKATTARSQIKDEMKRAKVSPSEYLHMLESKDADLLGMPFRITVGKSFTKNGVVEIRRRRDGFTEEAAPEAVVELLQNRINEELER